MVDIEMLWELQQLENKIIEVEKEIGVTDLKNHIEKSKETYNKLLQTTKKIATEYKDKDAIALGLKEEVENIQQATSIAEEMLNSGGVLKPKAISQLEKDIQDNENLLEEKNKTLQQLRKENLTNIKQIKRFKSKLEQIYEAVESSIKQLEKLQKDARKSLTSVYKNIEKINDKLAPESYKFYYDKKENLYPVLVPYTGDSCDGCKMQFSLMFTQSIEKNHLHSYTCENCGRVIIISQTQEI
ncbi:hypothetical protein [Alkalibaculum bacchi]|uniref:hypothetical protein n=1 Tax=Alkalibaculum bacchi TaxID=645887 RepID=UPI0026EF6C30|nr:hypothetical protein [Alkalibaculum bacchi]